jgi:hypothetical protein
MPGNEKETIRFILENKKKINLKYIDKIKTIKIPHKNKKIKVTNKNLDNFYSDDSSKKADIYLNEKGISIKQDGGSFAFNRIQRKSLLNFFSKTLGFKDTNEIINKIDNQVQIFHNKKNDDDEKSSFSPLNVMSKTQFYTLLKYLMLDGSPMEKSEFPAQYILNSKKNISSQDDLKIFNFDEYFDKYSSVCMFRTRRCWYGQESNSEHNRAKGLLKELSNKPWCFDDVSGLPNKHKKTNKRWRDEIPQDERKTCYLLFIEEKKLSIS